MYAPAVREAFEEAFESIYAPHKGVIWSQIVTPFMVTKRTNRSLVPYDKSISKQSIKQNQERYKAITIRRRLETQRVRTRLRK